VTEPVATAASEPGVVTQTSVVVAPAPTTQAEESTAPAATAESTTPLPFDGGAARVAGGAAAGVAAVFAFFL
jgi:glucan endo-1,3-beta-D-glucosidase